MLLLTLHPGQWPCNVITEPLNFLSPEPVNPTELYGLSAFQKTALCYIPIRVMAESLQVFSSGFPVTNFWPPDCGICLSRLQVFELPVSF